LAKITYIEHDGTEHPIEVEAGLTVMEGAVANLIPGIDAECGGSCACATCMVYVLDEWNSRLPQKEAMEEAMVESNPYYSAKSRLSCQIVVTDALDGIRLTMPKSQR
jgi:ferredoxin, 2Fe-2S